MASNLVAMASFEMKGKIFFGKLNHFNPKAKWTAVGRYQGCQARALKMIQYVLD